MAGSSQDERRFFRIVDFIGLCYRLIDEAEYKRLKVASRYAEVPSLDALSAIDQQLQLLLNKLKIKNADTAHVVALLNRKIDLLLEHSDIGEGLTKRDNIPQMQVDMSACGVAFPSMGPLERGQLVELELVLQAGKQHLKLLGKVVASEVGAEALSEGDSTMTHTVRLEFIDVSDEIQEYLIQYVVKRQSALLKAGREDKPRAIDEMKW